MNIEEFLLKIVDLLEKENNSVFPVDNFKEYEEWDSIAVLSLSAMLEDEFGLSITRASLENINSIQELYDFVNSKKNT